MKSPRVSSVDVDWAAVHTALSDLSPLLAEDRPDGAKADTLARLNEATQSAFPNIAASPIPVLLPFDTAAFLKDKAARKAQLSIEQIFRRLHRVQCFLLSRAGRL